MKSIPIGFIMLLLLTGCSSIHRMDSTKLNTISTADAQATSGKWEEVIKQQSSGKEVVVKIEAGQKIPLKLTFELPMADLSPNENWLLFTRDTYVYISPSKFWVSPDGQRWADINNLKAQTELFGINNGELFIGFGVNEKRGPEISITAH